MIFSIEIAGVPFAVTCQYACTKDFFLKYKTEQVPLFTVTVEQKHIDRLRAEYRATDIALGREPFSQTDRFLEHLAVSYAAMPELLRYGVWLFHGSAVVQDGKAYIFAAKSGVGKTTHVKLWLRNFDGCSELRGDKLFLYFKDERLFVCGSPFNRNTSTSRNEAFPVEAICLLDRDTENHIDTVSIREAFPVLLEQSNIPDGEGSVITAAGLVNRLSSVKLFRLGCNMDDDAAYISYRAMVNPDVPDRRDIPMKLKYEMEFQNTVRNKVHAVPLCDDDEVEYSHFVRNEYEKDIFRLLENYITENDLIGKILETEPDDKEAVVRHAKEMIDRLRKCHLLAEQGGIQYENQV